MKRTTPHLLALILLAALAILLVFLTWVDPPVASLQGPTRPLSEAVRPAEPLLPLPETLDNPNPQRSNLGRKLFHEPRLSRDGSVSCASCHSIANGGTDQRPRSIGVGGALGPLNAPTVLNTSLNLAQFWDGRAATLAEQINGPLHNPLEMDSSWPEAIRRLSDLPEYRNEFEALYPDGITAANIADAIVQFQLTLVTPNAPFDQFLNGWQNAISQDAQEGYARFKAYGCASCHQGANIGGNMFQRFGIMGDYFADRGNLTNADLGRFNVTGKEKDRHVFKVPSLRNIALTAPYFHDGSVDRLEKAVDIMGRYQLGRSLTDEDIRLIVAFLNTLTGDLPDGSQIIPEF